MTVLDNNKMLEIADWQSEHFKALLKIPSYMHFGIAAYVVLGQEPGDFLRSVLENDLLLAVQRADYLNRQHLLDYAKLLCCDLPMLCYGSNQLVRSWIASGGLQGQEQVEQCSA